MDPVILVMCLLGFVVSFGLLVLIRRIAVEPTSLPPTSDWIGDLSAGRYRPMLRLPGTDDTRFLRKEGCTARQLRAFRASRTEIIRGYLTLLQSDFGRITMAIRVLMVQSQQDRPDLALLLVRQKITFRLAFAAIYLQLYGYRWGLTRVDPSAIVAAFDCLRVELRRMVPAGSAA
jgi:hypothetical protein